MEHDPAELLDLCRAGEGLRVEFKRGLPADAKIARVLAGFANTSGGMLLVGVENRGRLIGLEDPDTVAVELERIARERIAPALALHLGTVELAGVALVAARVMRRRGAPHAALDAEDHPEFVQRRGSKTRVAAGEALRGLLADPGIDGLDELARAALAWLDGAPVAADVAGLSAHLDLGRARARRALESLERGGWIWVDGQDEVRRFCSAPR